MRDPKVQAIVDALTKALVDKGELIEAGWIAYRMFVLPKNCSEVQLSETHRAFFAGCQHLFASMNTFLDGAGDEPTASDMARMDAIHAELKKFGAELQAQLDARNARERG